MFDRAILPSENTGSRNETTCGDLLVPVGIRPKGRMPASSWTFLIPQVVITLLSYLTPPFTPGLEVSLPQSWGAAFPECQDQGGHTGFSDGWAQEQSLGKEKGTGERAMAMRFQGTVAVQQKGVGGCWVACVLWQKQGRSRKEAEIWDAGRGCWSSAPCNGVSSVRHEAGSP